MARRHIPHYLRVVGWTFVFWVVVLAGTAALVFGSGCPGPTRTTHMEAMEASEAVS
jgi:hypothetical protein